MTKKKVEAVTPAASNELQRDELGYGNLPAFEYFEIPAEGFAPGAVVNESEITVVLLIDDNKEIASAWLSGNSDVSAWTPTAPEGDGWTLAVVSENDEGVYAVFARPGVHGIATGKDYAREFLLGSLIKAATKHLKTLSVPWIDLKEAEQSRVLAAVHTDCREAMRDAIDIIASNARVTFQASVDQVVFKDGVKAVLSLAKGDWAHSLADAEGGFVTIVIEERSHLLQEGDALAVDRDQKALFDASTEDAPELKAA